MPPDARAAPRARRSRVIRQLTFRSGTVRGARFTPDPKTVIYAAAWEGRPLALFTVREDSSESSAVNLPSANLLAVSSAGEMAVALKPELTNAFAVSGTLARAPIAGGAAREMIEQTVNADFSPDGKQLAVIRRDGDRHFAGVSGGHGAVLGAVLVERSRAFA